MVDDLFDFEADVLVVGAGGAGLSAAVTAAALGASVIVFEGSEHIGGTTGASAGTAWIPNNMSLRDQGKEDPREDALRYMCRLSHPQYYYADHPTFGLPCDAYELIEAFYDSGSEAIDFLAEAGALHLVADVRDPGPDCVIEMLGGPRLLGFPDYGAELDENKLPNGRHVAPAPGERGMVSQLKSGAARHDVEIMREHVAATLLRNEEGEVAGLELRHKHLTVLARAHKAVVFASGGYAHNPELVQRYLPGRVYGTCATLGARGDFVRIGLEAGAQLGNMKNAWWKQVPVEAGLRSPTPPGVWVTWGDSMIQVNKYGHRVVNEKLSYHDRSQVHAHYDPCKREYPNQVLFLIYDDAVASSNSMEGIRYPLQEPGEAAPSYVITGETWDDLVAKIDARLAGIGAAIAGARLDESFSANLAATIERFNGFARTGKDLDFNRGDAPLARAWNGPNREGSPNPTLAEFAEEGPYHCIIVGAGVLDTNGGPVINPRAQVMSASGSPIPGLYGAGNCIASPAGEAYWGPGATIGLGITFGYLAGLHAAAESEKSFDPGLVGHV